MSPNHVTKAEGLTPSQVMILGILNKATVGLSPGEISRAGKGVAVNINTIGPVFDDSLENYPNSLRGRGLVRPEQYEGDDVRWFITPDGRRYAGFKARKIGPINKVPNELLDPLVITLKKTRTYGIEQFTQDDLTELRSKLPAQYNTVDVKMMGDLHNQILARRKQGAYGDKDEKRRKQLEKVVREFGPNGTVIPHFLTEDQLGQLYDMLGTGVSDD